MAATPKSKIPKRVQDYIKLVEAKNAVVCKEQKQLERLVKGAFKNEKLFFDEEKIERYLRLQKYFPFDLFEWEIFCFVLHNCVFKENGMPRWPDLFISVGRGAGKNGYLAFEDLCLLTHYHGIKEYDIDICANSEDQAKTTFNDIYEILEMNREAFAPFFTWTLEKIINKQTKSILRFRTNSPKSKDGLRSGKVDFDEVHEYQDYKNIDVFTTGLGKKRHPRRTYITTNGNVRDGVLDDLLQKAKDILNGNTPDGGFLPFICKLDDESEVDDEKMWAKPNPSLFLFKEPNLLEQIRKEYVDWKAGNTLTGAFMTKRMNLPREYADEPVTDFENLKAASKPIPILHGARGVVGIDYAATCDFASAGLLLKDGDIRVWIDHTWVSKKSKDLHRIKAPLDEWHAQNLLTWVDDEVSGDMIVEWISSMARNYQIRKVAMDHFRVQYVSSALKRIGFDAEHKNIKTVRPSDYMMMYPTVTSMFNNHKIVWGEKTMMRWYTNNAKAVPAVKHGPEQNLGNYTFGKIEPKSRKTDGFFALLAAMAIENDIPDASRMFADVPMITC